MGRLMSPLLGPLAIVLLGSFVDNVIMVLLLVMVIGLAFVVTVPLPVPPLPDLPLTE